MLRLSLSSCAPARWATGIAAACLLATAVPATAGSTPASSAAPTNHSAPAAATEDRTPLQLTIRQLTPGALPDSGPVRIRGTITNVSEETWTNIRVFPFAGDTPIRSASELQASAAIPDTAVVGRRITEVMHQIDELAPGATVGYRLRVPRRLIAIDHPGVHWFGVHALGTSPSSPRNAVADGRARTFLPYLPDDVEPVRTSVVLPLRHPVAHTPRGSIADAASWRRALTDGSLGSVLTFGAEAGNRPVTWLLDPAVLDTVEQLRGGNPGRPVSPDIGPEDPELVDPEDEAWTEGELPTADSPLGQAAELWLTAAERTLGRGEVLLLPYGDLDTAGASTHDPVSYAAARSQPTALLEDWDITGQPAVAPLSGRPDDVGTTVIDDNALVLVDDQAIPLDTHPDGLPTVMGLDRHRTLVSASGAAAGGPGPDRPRAAVAMRQRVLAEAAIRALAAGDGATPEPLLVTLPAGVGGNAERFWEGFDEDWITLTPAHGLAGPALLPALESANLAEGTDAPLPEAAFDRAAAIRDHAPVLERLFTLNTTLTDRLTAESLAGLGQGHRTDPDQTVRRLGEIQAWSERRRDGVAIEVPPGVTLSSDTGGFAVTLRNRLTEPVTVGLRAESGNGATIDPVEPVVIAAEGHRTVVVTAHAEGTGVHNLHLLVTDTDGVALGATATVPVRSGQVGQVIWWILGAGGGILLLALGVRLIRRLRGSAGDQPDAEPDPDHDPGAAEVGEEPQ